MGSAGEGVDARVRMWAPVCQAVALLLGPYAEVVLHDPDTDRVLADLESDELRAAPGIPRCSASWTSLDPSAQDVYGPYEKLLADGRRLSSVSAVLRDEARERPSAVLCINLDRTPLEQAAAVLSAFGAPTVPRPEPLFEQDWTERIQHIIGAYVRETRPSRGAPDPPGPPGRPRPAGRGPGVRRAPCRSGRRRRPAGVPVHPLRPAGRTQSTSAKDWTP